MGCVFRSREYSPGGGGGVFANTGKGSVGQLDFFVFIGEPVRNLSGECQVNAQSAADSLVCPPGSLDHLYRSRCCLLRSCLLPGWEQLRGNQRGRCTGIQSTENLVKGPDAGMGERCWACYSNWGLWPAALASAGNMLKTAESWIYGLRSLATVFWLLAMDSESAS